jgi:hypothetical protein
MQLLPAAKVLPQGFELVVRAKSPLGTMLAMFSVAVPVLLSVTVFAVEVEFSTTLPHVREVGVRPTTGPPPPPVHPVKRNEAILVCQLKTPLVCSY